MRHKQTHAELGIGRSTSASVYGPAEGPPARVCGAVGSHERAVGVHAEQPGVQQWGFRSVIAVCLLGDLPVLV